MEPSVDSAAAEKRRAEASGPGWQERFVDSERAPLTAKAVADSLSYIIIPDFCTSSERLALQGSARVLQEIYLQQGDGDVDVFRGIVVKWITECSRFSVKALLDESANAASASLLQRLLNLLEFGYDNDLGDDALSEVAFQVFGTNSDLQRKKARWYDEMSYDKVSNPEPMVNIYEEGGYFKKHGDGMHMTLLVVLENADEGGGTAFYTEEEDETSALLQEPSSHVNDDKKDDNPMHSSNRQPKRVERPPVGTAMIWGGKLLHSAMPVGKGSRTVFVGSFDLVDDHVPTDDDEASQIY